MHLKNILLFILGLSQIHTWKDHSVIYFWFLEKYMQVINILYLFFVWGKYMHVKNIFIFFFGFSQIHAWKKIFLLFEANACMSRKFCYLFLVLAKYTHEKKFLYFTFNWAKYMHENTVLADDDCLLTSQIALLC